MLHASCLSKRQTVIQRRADSYMSTTARFSFPLIFFIIIDT